MVKHFFSTTAINMIPLSPRQECIPIVYLGKGEQVSGWYSVLAENKLDLCIPSLHISTIIKVLQSQNLCSFTCLFWAAVLCPLQLRWTGCAFWDNLMQITHPTAPSCNMPILSVKGFCWHEAFCLLYNSWQTNIVHQISGHHLRCHTTSNVA